MRMCECALVEHTVISLSTKNHFYYVTYLVMFVQIEEKALKSINEARKQSIEYKKKQDRTRHKSITVNFKDM